MSCPSFKWELEQAWNLSPTWSRSFAAPRGHSFTEAARRLSLTPAAVSRNVAVLERNLGVRLFQRSTRRLVLTEAGEHFLASLGDTLETLRAAISQASRHAEDPAGTLKISMSMTLGSNYILPLLPGFLARYPAVRVDWHFDSRQVDLTAEGFDAAIGGGFDPRLQHDRPHPGARAYHRRRVPRLCRAAEACEASGRPCPPSMESPCALPPRGGSVIGRCETAMATNNRRASKTASHSTMHSPSFGRR